jgi:ABC-type phosphate transport system permease subunit
VRRYTVVAAHRPAIFAPKRVRTLDYGVAHRLYNCDSTTTVGIVMSVVTETFSFFGQYDWRGSSFRPRGHQTFAAAPIWGLFPLIWDTLYISLSHWSLRCLWAWYRCVSVGIRITSHAINASH